MLIEGHLLDGCLMENQMMTDTTEHSLEVDSYCKASRYWIYSHRLEDAILCHFDDDCVSKVIRFYLVED